jgi:AcrR family transcriptional regulator
MKKGRIDIGSIRREQVIDAAVAIIAEQGIQNLSLSEIEKKAGMSRGQLTYYFPNKEDILLAAFDRLISMLRDRAEAAHREGGPCAAPSPGWERAVFFMTHFLLHPPVVPEFDALQYTFLSQLGHREDFRTRLANLYEEWRRHIAQDFTEALQRQPAGTRVSPQTFATLVQALFHGLAVQRAADPEAYDPQEMLELCLDLLGNYLNRPQAARRPGRDRVSQPR